MIARRLSDCLDWSRYHITFNLGVISNTDCLKPSLKVLVISRNTQEYAQCVISYSMKSEVLFFTIFSIGAPLRYFI